MNNNSIDIQREEISRNRQVGKNTRKIKQMSANENKEDNCERNETQTIVAKNKITCHII